LLQGIRPMEVCNCQPQWIRWIWHAFVFLNMSFPLTQFWQYGIKNCQNIIVNLCEQYQPTSCNIPGLMVSISDYWSIVKGNHPIAAEDPQ
jgi:hypothetical protein